MKSPAVTTFGRNGELSMRHLGGKLGYPGSSGIWPRVLRKLDFSKTSTQL